MLWALQEAVLADLEAAPWRGKLIGVFISSCSVSVEDHSWRHYLPGLPPERAERITVA